jgi:hypothetical protein
VKSHVHAFICGACGGTLTGDEHEASVTCPWCETDNLIDGEDLPRTYWVEPVLDEHRAVRELRRAASRPQVERGFSRELRIERRDLLFLPFNALRAVRTGRMVIEKRAGRRPAPTRSSMMADSTTPLTSAFGAVYDGVGESGTPARIEEDTKILFSEIVLSEPAFDAASLGAGGVDFERNVFGSNGQPLLPYDRRRIAVRGGILEPEVHPRVLRARLEESGRPGAAAVGSDRRIDAVGVELYRVYYPVWVVRGTYGGRSHRYVVDAVDGTLLAGRVASARRYRAGVGTAGVFLAAAPLALGLRATAWWVRAEGFLQGDVIFGAVMALALLTALGWALMVMGWVVGSLHRSRELVFRGGALVEEVVDLPGRDPLSRWGLRVLGWSDSLVRGLGRGARHV